MKYDYSKAKERIENILSNKLEVHEKQSVTPNDPLDMGYYKMFTAIYINVKEASSLFCFTSDIIEILKDNNNLREIGLKNECIYAIYNTSNRNEVYELMDMVIHINTYLKLLSKTLTSENYPTIKYGIGIATESEFVIKAERRGVGLNNLVWQGDVLLKAQALSGLAFRKGIRNIVLSISVYDKIIYELIKIRGEKVKNLFHLKDDEINGSFYNTGIFKKFTVVKRPEVNEVNNPINNNIESNENPNNIEANKNDDNNIEINQNINSNINSNYEVKSEYKPEIEKVS